MAINKTQIVAACLFTSSVLLVGCGDSGGGTPDQTRVVVDALDDDAPRKNDELDPNNNASPNTNDSTSRETFESLVASNNNTRNILDACRSKYNDFNEFLSKDSNTVQYATEEKINESDDSLNSVRVRWVFTNSPVITIPGANIEANTAGGVFTVGESGCHVNVFQGFGLNDAKTDSVEDFYNPSNAILACVDRLPAKSTTVKKYPLYAIAGKEYGLYRHDYIQTTDTEKITYQQIYEILFDGGSYHISCPPAQATATEVLAGTEPVVDDPAPAETVTVDLTSLDGSNGFVINGKESNGYLGASMGNAGDMNNDGIDDFIISGFTESYVVFGSTTGFTKEFDLETLDGTNGFSVKEMQWTLRGKRAGDINADGFDDLVFRLPNSDVDRRNDDGTGTYDWKAGNVYILFGKNTPYDAEIDLLRLNGTDGFVIQGVDRDDWAGHSVASAGDFNGDGVDDLVIGAGGAVLDYDSYLVAADAITKPVFGRDYRDIDPPSTGAIYLIHGRSAGFGKTFDLHTLNGTNGFVFYGANDYDQFGESVAGGGDINGDGFDDVIVGAYYAGRDTTKGAFENTGASYVLYGSNAGFDNELNVRSLNGSNGFVVYGAAKHDRFGNSVNFVGDINSDNFDDMIIGAISADVNNEGLASGGTGASYVIFGKAGSFGKEFKLSSLDGTNGVTFYGAEGSWSGGNVGGAGDINADGIDDIVIGAANATNNNDYAKGAIFAVYGTGAGFDKNIELTSLTSSQGFSVYGLAENDRLGGVGAAGDINGDGVDDLLVSSPGVDNFELYNSGIVYGLYGKQ